MDVNGISSTEHLLVNAQMESRSSRGIDSHPMFQGTHEEYLANKKVVSAADRFVSIFFWVSVAAVVALVSIVIASLVLQSKSGKPLAVTSYYKTVMMDDGTQLSVLVTRPLDMKMKRPIVFELTSKRKDDAQYAQSWATAFELAKRGLIVAQVDARGTGSSHGQRSSLPYSSQDVSDGVQLVAKLPKEIANNNGQVGIFGLGSSGTLALLIAQQNPETLGAVVALHASENAFWNDIYPDGNLQFDLYRAKQEQLSIIPMSPTYNAYDSNFMSERFNISAHPPYIFSYLAHQTFDDFWKSISLDSDRHPQIGITIPVYLIGGIYNAHKDFALNLYSKLLHTSTKVKVVLGPFGYTWPDENPSGLGPSFNARLDVANWFKQWLNDEDNGFLRQPDVSMFYRDEKEKNGGDWRFEGWPITRAVATKFQTSGHVQNLTIDPTSGVELGSAWGPQTPNQATLDLKSATVKIKEITSVTTINGYPAFSLRVKSGDKLVNWNVRLEDVAPDGTVTLVTGCSVNGAMNRNAPEPALPTPPGEWHVITGVMHYTSWVFHSGHTVRLAVSGSAPGMQWATPSLDSSDQSVDFSSPDSWLEYTYIPEPTGRPNRVPKFTSEATPKIAGTPLGFPYNRTLKIDLVQRVPGGSSTKKDLVWHEAEGTYANANDVLIIGFVGQTITVLNDSVANMTWLGEATHVIVMDVDEETKSDPSGLPGPYLFDILNTLEQQYSYGESTSVTVTTNQGQRVEPVPNLSLHNRNWIRVDSSTTVQSDEVNYYVTASRKLTGNHGALPDQIATAVYPRRGH